MNDLFEDPDVTEIWFNSPSDIWYEKSNTTYRYSGGFKNSTEYENFVHDICIDSHMVLDLNHPFADGHWRGFRIHLVSPPASMNVFKITMRKHPQNSWTLQSLAERNWATAKEILLIEKLLHERRNIIVVGATGTGKTSVINACVGFVEDKERVVVIEDTNEIKLRSSLGVKLLTRNEVKNSLALIDQSELLKQALRMRPDRIVMGEVRGSEAKDLLLALSTGHRGSMGSLHAESAKQALLRLEMLVQMGAPEWNLHTIRTLLYLTIDVILVVGVENGNRKLKGLYSLGGLEEHGLLLDEIH